MTRPPTPELLGTVPLLKALTPAEIARLAHQHFLLLLAQGGHVQAVFGHVERALL